MRLPASTSAPEAPALSQFTLWKGAGSGDGGGRVLGGIRNPLVFMAGEIGLWKDLAIRPRAIC